MASPGGESFAPTSENLLLKTSRLQSVGIFDWYIHHCSSQGTVIANTKSGTVCFKWERCWLVLRKGNAVPQFWEEVTSQERNGTFSHVQKFMLDKISNCLTSSALAQLFLSGGSHGTNHLNLPGGQKSNVSSYNIMFHPTIQHESLWLAPDFGSNCGLLGAQI